MSFSHGDVTETALDSVLARKLLSYIASAFAGLVIGLVTLKLDINEGLDSRKTVQFNVAQIIAHLLSWGLVAPCLDILIYSEPIEKLFV